MKRARPSSPGILSPKKRKRAPKRGDLTYENLREHDRVAPPLTTSAPCKVSDAQYRAGHLRRANIFVDEDTPPDVSDYVSDTFYLVPDKDFKTLQRVADELWLKCKELARRSSGEAEWTAALRTAIDELMPPGLEIVLNRGKQLNSSWYPFDWRGDLKPPVHNPRPTISQKQDQSHQLVQEGVNIAGPTVPIYKLEDPRPAICVGLSEESLTNALEPTKGRSAARNFLLDLQDTFTLISDPHVTPSSLRFPFLMVEAKSGATGGNLYQAQNQAAVSGSSALRILQRFSDLHAQALDTESQASFYLALSITTDGPTHELWVHYQRPGEGGFYMVCSIGSWRTTLKDSSFEFARLLSAVLRWGNDTLGETILYMLEEM
ncbi:hypothetical protein BO94DRAFT_599143 [Aspergillus sclerotioniger CBS 115572]|uniref:DUF7924 domain-containing protein n=1 Tax=Aspergillus sclerotioniger CBS 115572 TaxID=1450535 RepID=A0A317WC51_9EURO|nr:hypothetical protein BO94DRAFT_599143 [Aspergillus sclerotioniger CBS 115572]PWY83799.1 hypothetical protein BO94DRAFT_599143 [Aspergillus sclerotioniger CBS 115572]